MRSVEIRYYADALGFADHANTRFSSEAQEFVNVEYKNERINTDLNIIRAVYLIRAVCLAKKSSIN
jgi:hypothetical protein